MPIWAARSLKISLALALGWYVLSQIQIHDGIELADGTIVEGQITGNWQESGWAFQPADPAILVELAESQPRPGFITLLHGLDPRWYMSGVAYWLLLLLVVAWRWRLLLKVARVDCGYWRAMRLCFVGYFFNNVIPGLTGGDVVRAVLVARDAKEHRARAAISVFVDRAIGLLGLLILGAAVLYLSDLGDSIGDHRLSQIRRGVLSLIAIVFAAAFIFLSQRLRATFKIDKLLSRLPMGDKVALIDDAITVYRASPGTLLVALALSILLQAAGVMCFWAIGNAIGASLNLVDNFAIYPIVQTISSLPIAPAGWGIGETLYGRFFAAMGSSFTLGVAVSVLFRLTTQVGFGLLGALAWAGLKPTSTSTPISNSTSEQ